MDMPFKGDCGQKQLSENELDWESNQREELHELSLILMREAPEQPIP